MSIKQKIEQGKALKETTAHIAVALHTSKDSVGSYGQRKNMLILSVIFGIISLTILTLGIQNVWIRGLSFTALALGIESETYVTTGIAYASLDLSDVITTYVYLVCYLAFIVTTLIALISAIKRLIKPQRLKAYPYAYAKRDDHNYRVKDRYVSFTGYPIVLGILLALFTYITFPVMFETTSGDIWHHVISDRIGTTLLAALALLNGFFSGALHNKNDFISQQGQT